MYFCACDICAYHSNEQLAGGIPPCAHASDDVCWDLSQVDLQLSDEVLRSFAAEAAILSRKKEGRKPRRGAKDIIKYLEEASEQCCWKCGRLGHYAPDCYAHRDVYGRAIETGIICYRCRRPGHKAPKCYAGTDVNGKVL